MAFGKTRTGSPADLLVVGLGNPGEQYAGTRHNVGADVVALLAERHGARLKLAKERALSGETRIGLNLVALAFPQTYMNESGVSVQQLVKRHSVDDYRKLVIVHDELDLDPGRVKLKWAGGLAGHNGLRSIKQHLGTADFVRIRIGVGRPPNAARGADHVLKRVPKKDREILDIAVQEAADAVELILTDGFDKAMNHVNTSA